jgi:hypothetical protein
MKADSRTNRTAIPEPASEEDIRQRAYELFEARGGEEGHELEDWLRAEEEIKGSKSNGLAA